MPSCRELVNQHLTSRRGAEPVSGPNTLPGSARATWSRTPRK